MKKMDKDLNRSSTSCIEIKFKKQDNNDEQQNNVQVKNIYIAPELSVEFLELENCVAANSATLSPGDSGDLDTPSVEDWINQGSLGSQDVDM